MRNILVVLNNAKPRIVKTTRCKKHLVLFSSGADGEVFIQLPIELKFVTFENGKCGVISVASERNISVSEALKLHRQLSGK
jgi:ssDNA-specific exonuclease RecJ